MVAEPQRAHFDDRARDAHGSGTVEDWVFVNMTGDTHPMHTHLFTHQVIGRTPFDVDGLRRRHGGPNGVPGGIDPRRSPPARCCRPTPDERGFKDTVKANPGYFTTIRAQLRAARRGDRTAELRAPLPHRGTRGQRHDAAPSPCCRAERGLPHRDQRMRRPISLVE